MYSYLVCGEGVMQSVQLYSVFMYVLNSSLKVSMFLINAALDFDPASVRGFTPTGIGVVPVYRRS